MKSLSLICTSALLLIVAQADAASIAVIPSQTRDATGTVALGSEFFLSSLGVNTHVDQGYNPNTYLQPLVYLGVRCIRDSGSRLGGLIMLNRKTGVLVDLLGGDVDATTRAARILASTGSLMSIEGPNEPNNFPVTYKGKKGGSRGSWVPVAELQRDLYAAVRSDAELRKYPVFHVSEAGAESDNVGLQFLTIPAGARTLFPDGTQFADYANPHNYVSGTHTSYIDNQAWQAADPTLNGRWDSLYGEYGRTWGRHFRGYSNEELIALPRVTSETGWDAANPSQERTQGIVLVNTYLSQFKRGWRYTFIYELGEGEGGGGNQGLFHKDWTPKLAATYIHNLTAVLADREPPSNLKTLGYAIPNQPSTVHDLLLQKSSGELELVVWGEQVDGASEIKIDFAKPQAKIAIYDTTIGVTPVRTLDNAKDVSLSISDHAMIVEIR